eukprot:362869-Chlamydomonas_euryale.AAC.1
MHMHAHARTLTCHAVPLPTPQIPFDYVIICKPLVEPIKLVFTRGWLACDNDDWWRGYWGAPCPGGDWLLAIARMFPFLLIFFMDTSL